MTSRWNERLSTVKFILFCWMSLKRIAIRFKRQLIFCKLVNLEKHNSFLFYWHMLQYFESNLVSCLPEIIVSRKGFALHIIVNIRLDNYNKKSETISQSY